MCVAQVSGLNCITGYCLKISVFTLEVIEALRYANRESTSLISGSEEFTDFLHHRRGSNDLGRWRATPDEKEILILDRLCHEITKSTCFLVCLGNLLHQHWI